MGNSRILIIDDDPNLRRTLAHILDVKGYEAIATASGSEALAIMAQVRINLALIDLGLPDIPGLDLLKTIRKDHPSTQAIILTGRGTLDSAIEATNMGAFSYLTKPYEIDQLLLLIERALEKQQMDERMRLLTEMAADAIVMIDCRGVVEFWNPAAERIFGYGAAEAVGSPLHTLVIPERLHDQYLEMLADCHLSSHGKGAANPVELTAATKGGVEVPVEVSLSATSLNSERHVIGIIRDIGERKRVESERNTLAEQLRHSQKMEAIGQLAGGIAHDFNNILTAIIGFSSLMKMKIRDDDPIQLDLAHILHASERAANLTRSILVFSRKQCISPHPTDLNEIVRSGEKFLRRVIGEEVELFTLLADRSLMVLVDSSQIEQVLINIAANACDAMPGGGRLVIESAFERLDPRFIAAHGSGREGNYAMFSLTDTGTGMDEMTRKSIFEPFFTTKEVGKGTGLGLSVAYGIINQHNGFILCDSEPGQGTTFRVYLPLLDEGVETEEEGPDLSIPTGCETILLAEDDSHARILSKAYLEHFGYRVIETADGEQAVATYREHADEISLALLDVRMPRLNGREVFTRMREINPEMKVIFMSGYTDDILQNEWMRERGLDVLKKPTMLKELMTVIRKTLGSGRGSNTRGNVAASDNG